MIAVYENEAGNAASLSEKGSIRIYQMGDSEWKTIREVSFLMDQVMGIAEARRSMIEMVQKLEGCKVFVAKEVVGQLYYVLEANGFESFEAEGTPEQFLEGIWEEVLTSKIGNSATENLAKPITYFEKKEKEGYYYLNLKKMLNMDCTISSKKLLIPFLHKKEFINLEVICDHLPMWLETEIAASGLNSEIMKMKENEYKVRITA